MELTVELNSLISPSTRMRGNYKDARATSRSLHAAHADDMSTRSNSRCSCIPGFACCKVGMPEGKGVEWRTRS